MSLEDGPPPAFASVEPQAPSAPRLDPEELAAQAGWLRGVARHLVRDPWGAEDVAQEALLAALASPPRSIPDAIHLRAWLGRVAFNLSRLDLRSGGRRRARERVVAREESQPSAVEELEARAAHHELARALARLDEPARELLQLRYFEGLSTSAIATRLGASELAIRKRLWRARERLRSELEPGPRRPRLAAWFAPLVGRLRRLEVAGLAAASVAVVLAVEFEGAQRSVESAAVARVDAARPALRASLLPREEAGLQDGEAVGGSSRRDARAPRVPEPGTEGGPAGTPPVPAARSSRYHGLVLDLEGNPQPGLVVAEARTPETALATSDVFGGFALEAAAVPEELVVNAQGFATVVPARYAPGALEAFLVVAPAEPLAVRVLGDHGESVPQVEVTLVARAAAFARLSRPVELASETLQTLTSEDGLRFSSEALPRGRGLLLRVRAPGYQTVERASESCGLDCVIRLVPEGAGSELAGTVSLADGRPAVGARVRLAMAETRTDGRGGFRLPLRGVEPDSALEVEGEGHAPHVERNFGVRLARGEETRDFDVVLEQPLDRLAGRLTGTALEPGWRVLAFAAGSETEGAPLEALCDADGTFELELPRGSHVLFALAPDHAASVRAELTDSRVGTLEIPLVTGARFTERAVLLADDGRRLAHARVELRLGLDAGRDAVWGVLESDERGLVTYERSPLSEVRLSVRHALLGPGGRTVTAEEPLLARAATLRIADAARSFTHVSLQDEAGSPLDGLGPVGPERELDLADGHSATYWIPPETRWVELLGPDGVSLRVPLAPRPGEALTLRP